MDLVIWDNAENKIPTHKLKTRICRRINLKIRLMDLNSLDELGATCKNRKSIWHTNLNLTKSWAKYSAWRTNIDMRMHSFNISVKVDTRKITTLIMYYLLILEPRELLRACSCKIILVLSMCFVNKIQFEKLICDTRYISPAHSHCQRPVNFSLL